MTLAMKRKGRNLKPIKHANIHNIPLNLYEPLTQPLPSASIPPSAVAPYQMIPNYMINPLAVYWPLFALQQHGIIPTSQSAQNNYTLSQLENAAVCIQKYFRGYMVRKEYVSWTFNPITRITKPAVYQTESLIYEVIQDLIIDSTVEICLDQYHPISRQLRAETMLFHALQELIHEVAVLAINDARMIKAGHPVSSTLDSLIPEHAFLINFINDFAKDILFEAIHDKVRDYALDQDADYALEYLVKGLVEDEIMPMLYDIYIEDSCDTIISEIITEFVYKECPAICKSLNVRLLLNRPSKPKSVLIDDKMNLIMDKMICEELLFYIGGQPSSEQFDCDVDVALLQNLVLRL